MTPYAPFDSRPKLGVAKPVNPEDPFRNIPRLLPRDARTPRNISEYERRAERDTDRIGPPDDAEKTPAQRPFELSVERRLDRLEKLAERHTAELADIKKSAQEAFQHQLEMYDLVKAIANNQRALEFERKWVPAAAWLVTTVIAVVALLRTFH